MMSKKEPQALKDKPECYEELQFYIDAFVMLSGTRKSMEVISLSDIFLYADTVLDDRIEMAKIIMEGDAAFLRFKSERNEATE